MRQKRAQATVPNRFNPIHQPPETGTRYINQWCHLHTVMAQGNGS
jgi:hypothetical protein